MIAVAFYDAVVALHVIAVIGSFGVLFAYPWLPSGTSAAHAARARLLDMTVNRGGLVALLLGLYLAGDRGLFGELWVIVPIVVIVVVGGITGVVLVPRERRLAAQDGEPADRRKLERETVLAGVACALLIAVAAFFMVAKPGA